MTRQSRANHGSQRLFSIVSYVSIDWLCEVYALSRGGKSLLICPATRRVGQYYSSKKEQRFSRLLQQEARVAARVRIALGGANG